MSVGRGAEGLGVVLNDGVNGLPGQIRSRVEGGEVLLIDTSEAGKIIKAISSDIRVCITPGGRMGWDVDLRNNHNTTNTSIFDKCSHILGAVDCLGRESRISKAG